MKTRLAACRELIASDEAVSSDLGKLCFLKVPLLCFWHNESLSGKSFQRLALCISKAPQKSSEMSFMLSCCSG